MGPGLRIAAARLRLDVLGERLLGPGFHDFSADEESLVALQVHTVGPVLTLARGEVDLVGVDLGGGPMWPN